MLKFQRTWSLPYEGRMTRQWPIAVYSTGPHVSVEFCTLIVDAWPIGKQIYYSIEFLITLWPRTINISATV